MKKTHPNKQQLKKSAEIKLALWKRMEDNDIDALIQLSLERGMMTQEDADFVQKLNLEDQEQEE